MASFDWNAFSEAAVAAQGALGAEGLFRNYLSDKVTVWAADGVGEGDEACEAVFEALAKASRSCFEASEALQFGRYDGLGDKMAAAKADLADVLRALAGAQDAHASQHPKVARWIEEKAEAVAEAHNRI